MSFGYGTARHNWTYWRSGITDALQFIGQSFHQQ